MKVIAIILSILCTAILYCDLLGYIHLQDIYFIMLAILGILMQAIPFYLKKKVH